ncbi:TRAP transporter substrate-binding protein [Vibrio aestuarianus]|uniref:TRAP transporter substrate-binding protein n=1 Tax=Vibrio aestuarianus TaxID=28171 RepID=A0ABD7YM48_9VIBR|nr:TRAP transporter substrate-binding protein [Vibrio aestuarianus]WGK86144.1 TRAP transporter substrate-binding protein [Vibrio aestuarianus]CAH8194727.1 putative TRAP-type C4-dicarboxylate transport system, periplasmic component [Vibrio aestuarianus]
MFTRTAITKCILLSATLITSVIPAHAETILRLAYAENSQPVKDALQYLGKAIEEKTNGEVKVQFFPDGQLGGERELVEMTQVGVVDITKVSSGLMESFSPVYGVFSLPYLFDSQEKFYKTMEDSSIMDTVYQSTEPLGFTGVGWYDSGARSFYMSEKPVKKLADLKGKKIRVMQSETSIKTMQLLGASPIAMSQSEVYTSLQQGIIDGAENNEFALTIARHGEVAPYYTYDQHTRIPDIILMSNMTVKKLTPNQLQAIEEAVKESIELEKSKWADEMAKTRKLAETEFGVQFFEVDHAEFKQAVQPIYDDLKGKPELYSLYQKINHIK